MKIPSPSIKLVRPDILFLTLFGLAMKEHKTILSKSAGVCRGAAFLLWATVWSSLPMTAHSQELLLKNGNFDEGLTSWRVWVAP